MPRKSILIKRNISKDPKYSHQIIGKLINSLMRDGKKTKAMKIAYSSIDVAVTKTGVSGAAMFFEQVIENLRPHVEVKSRRVGGATYRVPVEVKYDRSVSLAIRWLLASATKKSGSTMIDGLSSELIAAYNSEGDAIKKKIEMNKTAESNRAFAHFNFSRNKKNYRQDKQATCFIPIIIGKYMNDNNLADALLGYNAVDESVIADDIPT